MAGTARKSNKNGLAQRAIIVNELGLHARCAAQVAKVAQKARGPVRVTYKEREVDAASMLDVMTLAAAKGCTITLAVDLEDDRPILEELMAMVKDGFGEE